jgi:hypothetical protein
MIQSLQPMPKPLVDAGIVITIVIAKPSAGKTAHAHHLEENEEEDPFDMEYLALTFCDFLELYNKF